jgi:PadR family transcriptional regulator PadR
VGRSSHGWLDARKRPHPLILDGLCLHVLSSFQRTGSLHGRTNRRQRNLSNLRQRHFHCQPEKCGSCVRVFPSVARATTCTGLQEGTEPDKPIFTILRLFIPMPRRIRPAPAPPAPGDLSHAETLVLVALARLGAAAYGVAISDELQRIADRTLSIAGIYAALDRLEQLGLATPHFSAPRPQRGGRARRHYTLTARGRDALRLAHDATMRMWQGVVPEPQERGSVSAVQPLQPE